MFDREPDVWAEIFRHGTELLDHPQLVHDGSVITVADPALGTVRQPGPMVRLSATPGVVDRSAPALDQHEPCATGAARTTRRHRPHPTGALPLDGVTVLEFGTYYAAPYGATLLTDLGARVIKVEQLDGDPIRHIIPFPEVGAVKVLQGKESVALDIHTDAGREVVHDLVRQADAVLASFRAGVVERVGLDADTLLAINPDLVYLERAGLRRRRSLRPPSCVRADDRSRFGHGVPQRRRGLPRATRPRARRDQAGGDSHQHGGDGRGAGRRLLGTRRGDGAPPRPAGPATRAAGAGAEHVDAPHHGPRAVGGHARVRGAGRPSRDRRRPVRHQRALPPLRDRRRVGVPRRRSTRRVGGPGRRARARTWISPPTRASPTPTRDARTTTTSPPSSPASSPGAARGEWEDDLLAQDVGCVAVRESAPEAQLFGADGIGREQGWITEVEHPVHGTIPRLMPLIQFSRSATVVKGEPALWCRHRRRAERDRLRRRPHRRAARRRRDPLTHRSRSHCMSYSEPDAPEGFELFSLDPETSRHPQPMYRALRDTGSGAVARRHGPRPDHQGGGARGVPPTRGVLVGGDRRHPGHGFGPPAHPAADRPARPREVPQDPRPAVRARGTWPRSRRPSPRWSTT